jgi:hypothetical protein
MIDSTCRRGAGVWSRVSVAMRPSYRPEGAERDRNADAPDSFAGVGAASVSQHAKRLRTVVGSALPTDPGARLQHRRWGWKGLEGAPLNTHALDTRSLKNRLKPMIN